MYDPHLNALLATAELGSFSKAAKKLFISRPALVQQINLLEEREGIRFFDRTTKGVHLTPAGQRYVDVARKVIEMSERTVAECRQMQESVPVRMGILPNYPLTVTPQVVTAMAQTHPEVQVEFVDSTAERYFAEFGRGEFDVTAEYMIDDKSLLTAEGVTRLVLFRNSYVLAVPPASPLAQLERIDFADLEGQTIVWNAHDLFDGLTADEYFRLHRVNVTVEYVDAISQSVPARSLVSNKLVLHSTEFGGWYKPLVDVPLAFDLSLNVGFAFHTDKSPGVAAFLQTARQLYPRSHTE